MKINMMKQALLMPLALLAYGVIGANPAMATLVDPKFCRASQPFSTQATLVNSTAPVYVGGVRYSINASQMRPIYRYNWVPVPPPHQSGMCWQTIDGLTIDIPVDGDAGQVLLFDISGRLNHDSSLTASCGAFSGSDQGNKFVIQRQQVTGGSCRTMRLQLRPATLSSDVNLTVQIAEQL